MSTDWPFDPETGELMEAAPSNVTEISVSELSFALKRTLEEGFSHVRVRGELSRVSRPASGHCYFDLKDDKSVISAVVSALETGLFALPPSRMDALRARRPELAGVLSRIMENPRRLLSALLIADALANAPLMLGSLALITVHPEANVR